MEPLVSVVCITYNHYPYIKECLEGFVNQKTDFKYEVIIHDDASTDGTTEVIREYAEKYPEIIIPMYESENQYSQGKKFLRRIMCECTKGKYMAFCEGDDYWCDENKLQKQVDYMERNDDCTLVMHNGYSLNNETGEKKIMNPYPESAVLSERDVIIERKVMPATASMMYKSSCIKEMPDLFWNAPVGDRPQRMYLTLKGSVYYLSDAMCVYRRNIKGSFSDRVAVNEEYRKKCLERMIVFFDNFNEYTENKYQEEIEYVKSREYYHYHTRSQNYFLAMKTEYFKKNFSAKEKIKWFISMNMPDGMKKGIKKILKNE